MRFIDAKQIVFLQGLERERLVLKPNHIRGYQYSRGTPEEDSTQGLALRPHLASWGSSESANKDQRAVAEDWVFRGLF